MRTLEGVSHQPSQEVAGPFVPKEQKGGGGGGSVPTPFQGCSAGRLKSSARGLPQRGGRTRRSYKMSELKCYCAEHGEERRGEVRSMSVEKIRE